MEETDTRVVTFARGARVACGGEGAGLAKAFGRRKRAADSARTDASSRRSCMISSSRFASASRVLCAMTSGSTRDSGRSGTLEIEDVESDGTASLETPVWKREYTDSSARLRYWISLSRVSRVVSSSVICEYITAVSEEPVQPVQGFLTWTLCLAISSIRVSHRLVRSFLSFFAASWGIESKVRPVRMNAGDKSNLHLQVIHLEASTVEPVQLGVRELAFPFGQAVG